MVAEGSFREDLFYRISVVLIILPPLRERGDDLLLLARNYVEEFNRKFNKKVKGVYAKEAEEILRRYTWPGNVRELKNIIERIMILRDAGPSHHAREHSCGNKRVGCPDPVAPADDLLPLTSATDRIDYKLAVEKLTNKIKDRILERAPGVEREATRRRLRPCSTSPGTH
ncbi:MAG: hypothetical protein MZU91_15025 [Desulfosudis oleivorans]|nr:hypothetical protein [Desulfosudis oleivorans]